MSERMKDMTIAEFLLARIAEKEKPCICQERWGQGCGGPWCADDCRVCRGGDAYTTNQHVLDVCRAMRQIVDLHQDNDGSCGTCTDRDYVGLVDNWPCDTMRALASVFAEHPDYDDAWRATADSE